MIVDDYYIFQVFFEVVPNIHHLQKRGVNLHSCDFQGYVLNCYPFLRVIYRMLSCTCNTIWPHTHTTSQHRRVNLCSDVLLHITG